ncbi:MAG: DUF5693 family protein [Clostridia bacterium]
MVEEKNIKKPIYLIITILIIVAIIAATLQIGLRIKSENANGNIETVIDMTEINWLADTLNISQKEILTQFKTHQATTVLLKEQLISDIDKQASVRSGSDLLMFGNIAVDLQQKIKPDYNYLVISDKETYLRIAEQLQIKTKTVELLPALEDSQMNLIGTPLSYANLNIIGIGFDTKEFKLAKSLGFEVVLQVRSFSILDDISLEKYFMSIRNLGDVHNLMFSDETILGYPQNMDKLVEAFTKHDFNLVSVEFYKQKGIDALANKLDGRVIRLHTVPIEEMKKTSVNMAYDRFLLGAKDRNMRMLLVHFYFDSDQLVLENNLKLVDDIAKGVQDYGFTLGAANPVQLKPIANWQALLIGFGVIAFSYLLFVYLHWKRVGFFLCSLGLLAWLVLFFIGYSSMLRNLMALAAGTIIPTVGMLNMLKQDHPSLAIALKRFLKMTLCTSISIAFLVALVSNDDYMSMTNEFSGIKIILLAPVMLTFLMMFYKHEKEHLSFYVRTIWKKPLTIGLTCLGIALLGVMAIYLLRSGNDALQVSNLELSFRRGLDKLLLARPRTKEFLLHPFMLFALYYGSTKSKIILVLLGSIAQASMVNTFCHFHTPLFISALRTVHGLWIGLLLGVVAILSFDFLWKKYGKEVKRYFVE